MYYIVLPNKLTHSHSMLSSEIITRVLCCRLRSSPAFHVLCIYFYIFLISLLVFLEDHIGNKCAIVCFSVSILGKYYIYIYYNVLQNKLTHSLTYNDKQSTKCSSRLVAPPGVSVERLTAPSRHSGSDGDKARIKLLARPLQLIGTLK